MSKDDVQSHLDKGMYGTPLVNPEEQHKYMGTFRERCYLSMTVAEMKDPDKQRKLSQRNRKTTRCYGSSEWLATFNDPESIYPTCYQTKCTLYDR